MNKPVRPSDRAFALAERWAQADGYESVEAYVDALIESDSDDAPMPGWMRQRLSDGLASPSAGERTREKLRNLVSEGVARARKG
ncbi:MAG TPA: hypothetical protein VMH86_08390 [Rhizomicrobium sp.]|nr:hypothetical protein [Rhizomicrobium sp.]